MVLIERSFDDTDGQRADNDSMKPFSGSFEDYFRGSDSCRIEEEED